MPAVRISKASFPLDHVGEFERLAARGGREPAGAYGYGLLRLQQNPLLRLLIGDDPGFSTRAATWEGLDLQAVTLTSIREGAGPVMREINRLVLG